jgi:hypothetical protein
LRRDLEGSRRLPVRSSAGGEGPAAALLGERAQVDRAPPLCQGFNQFVYIWGTVQRRVNQWQAAVGVALFGPGPGAAASSASGALERTFNP